MSTSGMDAQRNPWIFHDVTLCQNVKRITELKGSERLVTREGELTTSRAPLCCYHTAPFVHISSLHGNDICSCAMSNKRCYPIH